MQRVNRDDLRGLLYASTVTLLEALPEPHHDAGHLPAALKLSASLAARLAPDLARSVDANDSGPACGRSTVAAPVFNRVGYAEMRVYDGGKADLAEAGLQFEGASPTPKGA